MASFFVIIFFIFFSSLANAQSNLLPKGIGAVRLGYRNYSLQNKKFDSRGGLIPIGSQYSDKFIGPNLLSGSKGTDLKTLSEELLRYNPNLSDPESLVNRLDLGEMIVDASGELSSIYAGLGYGFSDSLTAFAALPFISIKTKLGFSFSGSNNALQIRDELGGLAFDELREGLAKAANINVTDIKNTIQAQQMSHLDGWEHQGIGDIIWGANYDFRSSFRLSPKAILIGTLNGVVPTAYQESPDILSDISLGASTWGFGLGGVGGYSFSKYDALQMASSYTYFLPCTLKMRVPEGNEAVVSPERKDKVSWKQGGDYEISIQENLTFQGISPGYLLGVKGHSKNSFSGNIIGDYAALGKDTDSSLVYQQISLGFSSVDMYKRGDFFVPFLASVMFNAPISGRNALKGWFVELTVTSFFDTGINSNSNPKQAPVSKHL